LIEIDCRGGQSFPELAPALLRPLDLDEVVGARVRVQVPVGLLSGVRVVVVGRDEVTQLTQIILYLFEFSGEIALERSLAAEAVEISVRLCSTKQTLSYKLC
jgi:hypothetical protein